MNQQLSKLVAKELRSIADRFDAGTSEASENQVMDIMNMVTHIPMNKYSACRHLNIRRSRFDELVRAHKIPRGRSEAGSKELKFYRDELDNAARMLRGEKKI